MELSPKTHGDAKAMAEKHQNHVLNLTVFDQTIPRIYVRKILCFPFPDKGRREEATAQIREGLDATLIKWPFIAGEVGPARDNIRQNMIELRYTTPTTSLLRPDLLVVRELAWSYKELAGQGMPPSIMRKEQLSQLPEHPQPARVCPAFGLQVTFVEGGLLLCFAFHHAIFDGTTGRMFFQAFANAVKHGRSGITGADDASLNRVKCIPDMEDRGPHTKDHAQCMALLGCCMPEYDFRDRPFPSPSSDRFSCSILVFTSTTVQRLKDDVTKHIKGSGDDQSWVSANDCLCALIWIAVIRSRRGRLTDHSIAKFSFAVGIRAKAEPKLPANYMGNAIAHVIAEAQVSELAVDHQGGSISIPTISLAAQRIRKAILAVDGAYVQRRLDLLNSIANPLLVPAAFRRAIDMPHTGLDCSSWRDQIADIDFGIPGASAAPEFFRKTFSANEGSCNILPRTRGAEKEADWEVLLALSVEDMKEVCGEGNLARWVERVIVD